MYRLSNLAAKDFGHIFEYTLLNFGVKQADSYTESMHNALQTLALNPLMGYECPEIADHIRRHDHQKHAIFYSYQSPNIFILRILHQHMEPLKHFSPDYDENLL
ncbi:type II toxin-antitoxin system RelE/ParE family toxin [Vibrio mangrovi]|uniref:Toxin n=1 Tax=Vibrio mangrovi TaxID=474394 RepID=A0A1Y6INI4_9VIBR|nr:type II toxin-antitoxin system RelE/ParE family toxin [Vibrio mangrovi]MDW6003975.1 type II toxin-antitoxin system RelE/ParE family toxin [Vibrio mangrovi]SMR99229.1 Toxin ParE1 [Vibrio mangrovi]